MKNQKDYKHIENERRNKITLFHLLTCKHLRIYGPLNFAPSDSSAPDKAKIKNCKVPQIRMIMKNSGITIVLASTARKRATTLEFESPSTWKDMR